MSYYPDLIESLATENERKIIFLILDGVGGLPTPESRSTELEKARTPHLDRLASRSSCGLIVPIMSGVTTGSGPGHFALFGYDPVENNVGRGVLEASGIGFDLTDRDLAVRGNFATIDNEGRITDRRAGRISTEENERVCQKIKEEVKLPGVEMIIKTVKEHRLLVVFRGDDLHGDLIDTDPQETGVPPLEPEATTAAAEKTAALVRDFVAQVRRALSDEKQANMVTLRGFAKHHPYPSLRERFKLRALCLANYPMYRGVSRLVGMTMYEVLPTFEAQVDALEKNWQEYDFFFLHAKTTDKTGEDGDFDAKVKAVEELDPLIGRVAEIGPDVMVVTGDHSTPSALKNHSWHPVPALLYSEYARLDEAKRMTETECLKGALGQIPAKDLMPLALGHALKLNKFGA